MSCIITFLWSGGIELFIFQSVSCDIIYQWRKGYRRWHIDKVSRTKKRRVERLNLETLHHLTVFLPPPLEKALKTTGPQNKNGRLVADICSTLSGSHWLWALMLTDSQAVRHLTRCSVSVRVHVGFTLLLPACRAVCLTKRHKVQVLRDLSLCTDLRWDFFFFLKFPCRAQQSCFSRT